MSTTVSSHNPLRDPEYAEQLARDLAIIESASGAVLRRSAATTSQPTTRTVTAFSFEDLGVNSESYFQGAGTAYTDWDEVYVGIGDTAREAAEDAVESLACSGDQWDSPLADKIHTETKRADDTTSAHDDCTCEPNDLHECLGDCHDDCDLHHYVVLYVRYSDS